MITILRVSRTASLLTAEVFEELFVRHIGSAFTLRRASLETWCSSILGPPEAPHTLDVAARHFDYTTSGIDFFCPNWECIPLTPLFLALRNRCRAPVRLLFISHAAGAYVMEWALLRPLLAPGDVIVTPSQSARDTVTHLSPDLSGYLRVISHPMEPLPPGRRPEPGRVVSLGRINADKLLHRQIEAVAVIRDRGRRVPSLQIAGALDDGAGRGPTPYARGLGEKIRRLGLQRHVELTGPIRGNVAKGAFISRASLLLNLSVSIEESFPKTPVESLGLGVPVLGTDWNGIRDTVGSCGRLLPVMAVGSAIGTVDLNAEQVADGIESLLAHPPRPEACRAHVEQFRPEVSVPKYRAALEEAMAMTPVYPEWPGADLPAAPPRGLLGAASPLTDLSWRELFAHQCERWTGLRQRWAGQAPPASTGDRLYAMLQMVTLPPLERFFARLPGTEVDSADRPDPGAPTRPLMERFAARAAYPGLPSARLSCAAELVVAGEVDLALRAVEQLERAAIGGTGPSYLRAEVESLMAEYGSAFQRCALALDRQPAIESEAHRVRQAARIARKWGRPELALPYLTAWLDRFPDSQESGPVWLERCVNATRAGEEYLEEAAASHRRARVLLGDIVSVAKAERLLAACRTAAVVA
jgi:glycosyltransferase involved in cell wall biosynthesis